MITQLHPVQQEALLEKIAEYSYLIIAVDAVLDQKFKFISNPTKRMKRGMVHDTVADALHLVLNNFICSVIKERINAKGAHPYTSRGVLYYKFLESKE